MADVTLDPKNANTKELYGQGIRAYVLQDYDTAVRAFSKTSELLAVEYQSDTHDSLGDVYLYYGKSLLELWRRDSGPLGDGVLKNVDEESETEEIEGEPETDDKSKGDGAKADGESEVNGDSGKTDEDSGKADGDSGKADGENTNTEETTKEDSTDEVKGDEAKPEEESGDKPADEEKETEEADQKTDEEATSSKKEGENEDDLSDLQVAWEVLELSKRIFTTRGEDGKKNLAEAHIVLGEISLESGNFASAIEDILEGLKIQKTLYGNDSRAIAETYYKLGGAYATNAQINEAIESFSSALEYLKNKIKSLKEDEEHKEDNQDEIQELDNLIPEIEEKIADMKNLKVELANKMNAASTEEAAPKANGNAEASTSKQVNDISHLVKRKRKDEDPEEKPAKKPSP